MYVAIVPRSGALPQLPGTCGLNTEACGEHNFLNGNLRSFITNWRYVTATPFNML
jgi:hypothetical protein